VLCHRRRGHLDCRREGLLTTLLWRLWPHSISGIDAGPALGYIGIFLFPVAYLQLRAHAPRWVWVHRLLAAADAELGAAVLCPPAVGYALVSLLGAISAPLAIITGLLVMRRQPRGR
jgi:hypothetical protein